MAFSESLGLGNSTFLDIERRALREDNISAVNGDETNKIILDIINESPTSNNTKNFNKTKSRIANNYNQSRNDETSRRPLRRGSKVEVLESSSKDTTDIKKTENFTQLFESDFTHNSLRNVNSKNDVHCSRKKEESMVHVSQLKAALNIIDKENRPEDCQNGELRLIEKEISELSISHNKSDADYLQDDADDIESVFNAPIFSDDMENLLLAESNKPTDEDNKQSNHATLNSRKLQSVEERESISSEERLQHLNESVFSFPLHEIMEMEGLTAQLEESKREIKENSSMVEPPAVQLNVTRGYDARVGRRKNVKDPPQGKSEQRKVDIDFKGPRDLESLKHISAWNLPPSVLNEYNKKGVVKMFDWQIECLSNPKVLFDHCNLVYSAPTSAGKTLVSEILLLKTVLERNKKALLILPFISVVREKMLYLQDLLTPAGYRVEGFYGGYTPPGGFEKIHVAICTIEKANSIVNRLLEQGQLEEIGTIIVDEIHLISDPGRGYILELLLAKVLYMSRKFGFEIQIITMSATLANVELLKRWLNAELFITNFRPVALEEMIKIGCKLYNNKMQFLRDITDPPRGFKESLPQLPNDSDHVAHLCLETLLEGCSVIVFCPSKDWCENLSMQLAGAVHALGKSGSEFSLKLREQINRKAIEEMKRQLRDIPTGLDSVLEKTITYACAFHHAGLTTEERDIIEQSFKGGILKIIVATSTLSCGVNLPARRVIIRSPLFGGKQMSSLTYRQMIGRAGRTGKDTLGESILICTEANARTGRELIGAHLKPLSSCLDMESSTHLKRALLEVISSGIANTKAEVESFVNCTLLSVQKQIEREEKDSSTEYSECISEALDFLLEYEFIRLQIDEEKNEEKYVATRLGLACLASSMPPTDGLILFAELQKSRRCFVLESELHAVYLVTPYSVCYQLQDLDWLIFLDFWEKLTPAMKKVGELVGVKESFLVRAMRGQPKLDYKLMQIHKRFYTALALQELVNETPINVVAHKYKCTRGHLQGLQQMAATFAGIVTAFCNSLQWNTLALVVSQFRERLYFGVHSDLIDLMRLPDLNQKRARALHDAGITSLVELANCDVLMVEKILHDSLSFDSAKQRENEDAFEAEKRNKVRNIFITGKPELSVSEAAKLLITEARIFVQHEIGAGNIKWSQENSCENGNAQNGNVEGGNTEKSVSTLHMSCEERQESLKRRSNESLSSKNQKQIKKDEKVSSPKEIAAAVVCEKAAEDVVSRLTNEAGALKGPLARSDNSIDSPQPSTSREALLRSKRKQALEIKRRKLEEKQLVERKPVMEEMQSLEAKQLMASKQSLESAKHLMASLESMKTFTPKSRSIAEVKKVSRAELVDSKNVPNSAKICLSEVKKAEATQLITNLNLKTPKAMKYDTPKLERPQDSLKKSLAGNKLRRSPRNHNGSVKYSESRSSTICSKASSGKKNEKSGNKNKNESFEFNSSLDEVLKLEDQDLLAHHGRDSAGDDEIPNSQNVALDSPANRTSSRHVSRFMRSYRTQRPESPKAKTQGNPVKTEEESKSSTPSAAVLRRSLTEPKSSSSIEISDLSFETSLMKNPLQLNASHILSCSKEDTDSSSFKSIDIIDICGNEQLFRAAFKELYAAKRFACSLGLEKMTNKRKPLIGGNLLINQATEAESNSVESILFQVDDLYFLAGIAFCAAENVVFYMNMQEKNGDTSHGTSSSSKVNAEMKVKYLRMLFESKENTLLMYDAKEQLKILMKVVKNFPTTTAQLEDPKIANWLLQPDNFLNLKQMAQQYAPECVALASLCGGGRGFAGYGLDTNSAIFSKIRCSVEACITVHILKGQLENLERIGTGQLSKFFKELEMPLQLSLMQMECLGFAVNEDALRKLFQKMVETLKKLENKIYEMHGSKFNLGSTTAVGRVLGLHRKANGRVCTSRQVLEKIDSPISQLIIAYRKLSATLTKNVQPLLQCVGVDGRIHGQSLTCTATGRISMMEPNLQNVAKDFEVDFGKEKVVISCRSAFYPRNARRCLISADFCQLEMRILAHLSQDSSLLQVMNSESDIFIAIAARWNKISESKVSEQLRNGTKQICYGIVYGMGMRALAESLKCTDQEALMISEQFHVTYPGIRSYAEKVVKFARNNGYIETITGRRRYLENINSSETNLKNQAERQSLNSAIQGSAADIAKSAILRIEKNLIKYRTKLGLVDDPVISRPITATTNAVRLVLHIHDELLFEVPEDKAKKIAKVISLTMQNCVKLNVPLKVKLRIGKSWADLKEVKV